MATVKLLSNDNQAFDVPKELISHWTVVNNMLEDLADIDSDTPIPLPKVDGSTLKRAIAYTEEYHKVTKTDENENEEQAKPSATARETNPKLDEWELKHVNIPDNELFELIKGANYLEFQAMLNATCKKVANEIKGKTPEEIRNRFKLPEEEETTTAEEETTTDETMD